MTDIRQLATKPVGRLLWQYSLPAVIGMVVVSLYNVIDRIFIGHAVGPEAIAGLAITFPVMNLVTAFGVLVGGGASARVSILLGQKRLDDAAAVLGNALVLTLIIGTAYVCAFALFLDDILVAFGADKYTLPPAHEFMSTLLPGLLIMNLTLSFNNIQRASGYPKRAMAAMLISAGINVVLAPIFIFVFDMGLRGAALATVCAMSCAMIFVFYHFTRKTSTLHFTRGIYRLRGDIVGGILSIGAAPALINVAGCLVNILINRALVEHSGGNSVSAVGAAGIFTTYTQFVVMIVLGICQGMQPIVGYNYGACKFDRLKRAFFLATAVSTGLCVVSSIGAYTIPDKIAGIFTADPQLIATTVQCLSISMLCFSVVAFQITSTTLFQSIGSATKAILLGLTRQVIFLVPLMLWLPSMLGLRGVWMSFPISDAFATAVTLLLVVIQFRQFRRAAD